MKPARQTPIGGSHECQEFAASHGSVISDAPDGNSRCKNSVYSGVSASWSRLRQYSLPCSLSLLIYDIPNNRLVAGFSFLLSSSGDFHLVGGRSPIHVGQFALGAKSHFRLTVAIETPTHAEWLILLDNFHIGHITVATEQPTPARRCDAWLKYAKSGVWWTRCHWIGTPVAQLSRTGRSFSLSGKISCGNSYKSGSWAHLRQAIFDIEMAITAIHPQIAG